MNRRLYACCLLTFFVSADQALGFFLFSHHHRAVARAPKGGYAYAYTSPASVGYSPGMSCCGVGVGGAPMMLGGFQSYPVMSTFQHMQFGSAMQYYPAMGLFPQMPAAGVSYYPAMGMYAQGNLAAPAAGQNGLSPQRQGGVTPGGLVDFSSDLESSNSLLGTIGQSLARLLIERFLGGGSGGTSDGSCRGMSDQLRRIEDTVNDNSRRLRRIEDMLSRDPRSLLTAPRLQDGASPQLQIPPASTVPEEGTGDAGSAAHEADKEWLRQRATVTVASPRDRRADHDAIAANLTEADTSPVDDHRRALAAARSAGREAVRRDLAETARQLAAYRDGRPDPASVAALRERD